MAKNQTKAKQHPETELLLFEHPKIIGDILKNVPKNKYVSLNELALSVTMKMRLKMKNILHRCDINRHWQRHGHKYTEYKIISL